MPRKPSSEAPSSPKKKVPKALVKPKKSLHPKYEDMIIKAISHFHTRGGSSVSAITKYILSNYEVPKEHLKTQLRLGLKRAIEKNLLQKIKASYKISDGAKGKMNKDTKLKEKKENNDKDKEIVKSKISKVPKSIPSKKKMPAGAAPVKKPGRKADPSTPKKDVTKVKKGPKSNIKKKSQVSKRKPKIPASKAKAAPPSRQGTRTRSKI